MWMSAVATISKNNKKKNDIDFKKTDFLKSLCEEKEPPLSS